MNLSVGVLGKHRISTFVASFTIVVATLIGSIRIAAAQEPTKYLSDARAFVEKCAELSAGDKKPEGAPLPFAEKLTACEKALIVWRTNEDSVLKQDVEKRKLTLMVSTKENARNEWGERWLIILYGVDALLAVGAVIAIRKVIKNPKPMLDADGDLSFSQTFALIGMFASGAFLVYISNLCLAHFLEFGTWPDELGKAFIGGVTSLIGVILPYIFKTVSNSNVARARLAGYQEGLAARK